MSKELDLNTLNIDEVHAALLNGAYTVRDVVTAYLEQAKRMNGEVFAYLEFYDDIDAQIDRAQKMFDDRTATKLTGIPVAVKDNILVKGKVSSGASKILEHHRAIYNATVIKRLIEQGAVLIGRTNMDEFAMGSTTENSAYGITKNPVDLSRVPGGSSGGSAAAVAMNGALVALGSDTGGSVRLPASFCGLVGLKPTYGMVSRHGLMAMASSFDQIGPIGKTVDDVEALYRVIAQHDAMDSTSIPEEVRSVAPEKKSLRIGIPRKFIDIDGMDPDVREQFENALRGYQQAGHEVVDIELPHLAHALPVYYILVPAEVSSNLARYDGIRYGYSSEADTLREVYTKSRGEGFGSEVRRRVLLGTYVLSAGYYDAYYYKANTLREIIRDDFAKVFEQVDLIATPTAPTPAYKIGEKSNDPLAMYLGDVFTVTANVAGVPALSVPMGVVTREGMALPVGLQLIAPHMHEEVLLRAGRVMESIAKK